MTQMAKRLKSAAYSYTAPTGETVLLADDFNNGSIDGSKWMFNDLYSGFTDPTVSVVETQSLMWVR